MESHWISQSAGCGMLTKRGVDDNVKVWTSAAGRAEVLVEKAAVRGVAVTNSVWTRHLLG